MLQEIPALLGTMVVCMSFWIRIFSSPSMKIPHPGCLEQVISEKSELQVLW